ncbi:unnamed protein product [Mycena citricolor]|uniref:Alpha/beta hydrolase fold-3 domain-containing protein n=1 Tax=Mycena citricolor TaxID=2018698 RepID=A0AAD2K6D6_9AGAR|nr:unnamed protein product [Mycena citricolor]
MIDHLVGRPSPNWKRTQVFLVILFWVWRLVRGNPKGPSFLWLELINRRLQKYTPWQVVLSTLTAVYVVRNFDKILGLQSPEPHARLYSPSYYRATWINTGLDAGFATATAIRTKWIRDICSIVFSLYYILYPNEADEKLRRFRSVPTVEVLRRCWEKTSNPYIRAVTHLPHVAVRRKIIIPRPSSSTYDRPIVAYLFFSGSEKHLRNAADLILDFPGGGFVAMSPEHHEERLRMWTRSTGKPVLSIDYGKAPEFPYPFAIDEAFDTYKVLAESGALMCDVLGESADVAQGGALIGMSTRKLNFVVTGDSAGAALAANVVFKIIEHNETHENRLLQLYIMDEPRKLRVLRAEDATGNLSGLEDMMAQKDHLKHVSPLSMVGEKRRRRRPARKEQSWKDAIRAAASGSGTEKESDSPVPRKKHSGSLRTPSQPRSTFLEPRKEDADAESDEDYDHYREEDRPIGARVFRIPRTNSAVVQQQQDLSVAVEAANTKATENFGKGKKKEPIGTRLTMTSRTGYFQDRIITPSMMRAMAILYIGPYHNPDFATDYHLSPILAPDRYLYQFPNLLMHCGEKDPFLDDTVIFAGRVREAKRARRAELELKIAGKSARFGESLRMTNAPVDIAALQQERDKLAAQTEEDWVQLVIWSEWSHGYLQMAALMAEAKAVIEELAEWIDGAFNNHCELPYVSRRRDSPSKNVPPTSEPETDDSGITFAVHNRSLSGGNSSERVAPERLMSGQVITESEMMRRRRLLDSHVFE